MWTGVFVAMWAHRVCMHVSVPAVAVSIHSRGAGRSLEWLGRHQGCMRSGVCMYVWGVWLATRRPGRKLIVENAARGLGSPGVSRLGLMKCIATGTSS